MLILNPDNLKATQAPLLHKQVAPSRFGAIVRIGLAVAASAAAGVAGFAITQHLGGAWPLWTTFAAAGAFVYLASLMVVTVQGIRWHLPVSVIWGACFALGLPWRSGPEAFAIAGIVSIAGVLAYGTYYWSVESFTTLHTFTVTRRYASALASGVVISLIVLYGAALSRGSALLPQGILAQLADQAATFVPTFVPGVTPSKGSTTISVNDLAAASVRNQLEGDERYLSLTPQEQAEVMAAATREAAASFTKQLGVEGASPNASIGTVAQGAVSGFLGKFQDKYGWYFTLAWLLGAFFIARSAAFILTVIIGGLAWLTITGAVALGVMQIRTVPSTREELVL